MVPSPTISTSLLDQARAGQRDPLAIAVRQLLLDTLLRHRIQRQDAEELCQLKTVHLLQILLEGRVEQGKEDGYVRRCGEMLAKTYFRKRKRATIEVEEAEIPAAPPSEDIEDREKESERRVAELYRVLAGGVLTQQERDLLQDVYVLHLPIGQLVERELQQNPTVLRGPRKGEPRTTEQARNSIDQRLTRARARLEEEMKRRLS